MAILEVLILEMFPSQTAKHYAPYITDIVCLSVCVCPQASPVEPADRLLILKIFTHVKATSML